jgi:hypothetical protein
MYKFFMSLKQPDGSFLVAHHAEVDVRFVSIKYLRMCCIMLNLDFTQRDILSNSCRLSTQSSHPRTGRRHCVIRCFMPNIRRGVLVRFTALLFTFSRSRITSANTKPTVCTHVAPTAPRRSPWRIHVLCTCLLGDAAALS